jgi:predicted alpha/beta hydrolase family esterase
LSEAEFLHEHLGGTLEVIANGGHLNTSAGFQTFEAILNYV